MGKAAVGFDYERVTRFAGMADLAVCAAELRMPWPADAVVT